MSYLKCQPYKSYLTLSTGPLAQESKVCVCTLMGVGKERKVGSLQIYTTHSATLRSFLSIKTTRKVMPSWWWEGLTSMGSSSSVKKTEMKL